MSTGGAHHCWLTIGLLKPTQPQAKQFTALEGSIESRFEEKFSRLSVAEQAMAAAAAGKGVLKFSPNKPKSRGPPAVGTEDTEWRDIDDVQPFGLSGNRRPSSGGVVAAARNAAVQLGNATAAAEAAATAVGRRSGTGVETDRATAELESSIRDLQGIVANLSAGGSNPSSPAPPQDAPTRRETGGALSLAASTRAVQSERYAQERQERQARLQKLYAELNKT